ncbi:hypothetical protein BAUCODRAFT_152944 [Baudoinia panamericana UAMH 10762]|uniref:Glycoside hydrolase family 43 protein n=1 Tax=Baudoinia panamericana (strain UAMH 10762) TaxID=717646 RepID=M2MU51_BAUPA|nr:uncharacterized protein BAUCODRAFT_152944 [Baudoinia panamericana UAMH 10762]EMD00452.1 hypothetical protein BAUCODRAFT_152944 [Baudoinia panamericana UAMH 10762]
MRLSVLLASLAAVCDAAQVKFTNNIRLLFDVDGNQIDAYGSKISNFNGVYYLYGNSFAIEGVAFGIKSYSSVDLINWKYEGFLFDPYSNTPCNDLGGCGRPHIVFNPITQLYILWANAGSSGYPVATSSTPSGPFFFLSSPAAIDPQFNGLQPADFTVEILNNTGYIVFSALNFRDPRAGSLWPPIFQTLHASQLTSNLENTTEISYPVVSVADDLIDQEAESPDIFMRNGIYYIVASNTCGYCNGSIGLVYRSASIQGPWMRQIIAGYSCNGQVEGVLPLVNPSTGQTTYIWHSTSVPGGPRVGFGGHIFQPLQFNGDGSVQDLNCAAKAQFTVDFQAGNGTVASGNATMAGQATPLSAEYDYVCDSDQFVLYQTWTAAKAGTISSVSVNIAASVQTVPLSLTVFRFDSYSDLIAPEYKYTTMGTATFNRTSLSYVFDVANVPVTSNATVQQGDLLGLAISGADFVPYCHLEYSTGTGASSSSGPTGWGHGPQGSWGGSSFSPSGTYRLFQQGVGQNSWRGLQGTISPIYERLGKSVKFFVTYA